MRLPSLSAVLVLLAVWGCGHRPDGYPEDLAAQARPYPALAPFAAIPTAAPQAAADPRAAVAARVAALKARAQALQTPVLTPADTARLGLP